MTDEHIMQGIRVAIRNAWQAGRLTKGSSEDSLVSATQYAEAMIMPAVAARVDQGIEDAWRAHLERSQKQAETS